MSSTPAMRRLSREPMAAADRAGGPGAQSGGGGTGTRTHGGGAGHAGTPSPTAAGLQLPAATAAAPTNGGGGVPRPPPGRGVNSAGRRRYDGNGDGDEDGEREWGWEREQEWAQVWAWGTLHGNDPGMVMEITRDASQMEKPLGARTGMHREDTRGQGSTLHRENAQVHGLHWDTQWGFPGTHTAQGKCPETQSLHRDAQGELSRAVPKGGTCYWLRLKASRKGGDQAPMGKPLLSEFLSSQVIHA